MYIIYHYTPFTKKIMMIEQGVNYEEATVKE